MREDTESALAEFEIKTFGNQKNIAAAETLLHADEHVLFVTPTNITVTNANTRKREALPGVVFLTDKRLVFQYKVLMSFSTEVVSLDEIRSVSGSGNGLSGGHVEINTLTKSFDILVNYKRDIVQRVQQVFEAASKNFRAVPAGSCGSAADEILKFKGLLDSGIITAEEFEAKKKQLLGI